MLYVVCAKFNVTHTVENTNGNCLQNMNKIRTKITFENRMKIKTEIMFTMQISPM